MMSRTVQLLRHDAYCPVKAEIRAADNQSDSRICYSYDDNNNNNNNTDNNNDNVTIKVS